ncbi:MAG TPA: hypothetical protein VIL09_19455 [Microvirga sp.]|jgi:hypothetical protein
MTSSGSRTRDDRLKAALRENLKRRKAQARGRTAPDGSGAGATGAMEKPQTDDGLEPDASAERPGE